MLTVLSPEGGAVPSQVETDQIAVMAPQEAIYLSMLALLSPGDHVICTFPGYQSLHEARQGFMPQA